MEAVGPPSASVWEGDGPETGRTASGTRDGVRLRLQPWPLPPCRFAGGRRGSQPLKLGSSSLGALFFLKKKSVEEGNFVFSTDTWCGFACRAGAAVNLLLVFELSISFMLLVKSLPAMLLVILCILQQLVFLTDLQYSS